MRVINHHPQTGTIYPVLQMTTTIFLCFVMPSHLIYNDYFIRRKDMYNMSNQNILDTINNYLNSPNTEKIIESYIINALSKFDLENLVCLQVEDNTLNGIDNYKFSWRAHFVNLKTEKEFFIEVVKLSSDLFEIRCFTFDDNENMKMIKI